MSNLNLPYLKAGVRLTSQDELFPTGRCFGMEDHERHKERLANQLFTIEDDLLYSCITYGEGVENPLVAGFTKSKSGLGYALLAFFASRALGLYRLPFCPDRAFEWPVGYGDTELLRGVLSQLTPPRVDAICNEVSRLYEHTQRMLREAGVTSVNLKRNIKDEKGSFDRGDGYAELLFKLKSACEIAGRETLRIEMDVLNSYGDDGGYSHYPVRIAKSVVAEDILYCSNLIRSRKRGYDGEPTSAVEPGEWVVINRTHDGVVEVPVADIQLNTKDWLDRWERRSKEAESAKRFLEQWDPVILRGTGALNTYRPFNGGVVMRSRARIREAIRILWTGRLRS